MLDLEYVYKDELPREAENYLLCERSGGIMVKNYQVMVCLLAELAIFCKVGAAAEVQKPTYVSFHAAVAKKRKSFFAEHRVDLFCSENDGKSADESDGVDPDDLDVLDTQELGNLRHSLAASSEHIVLLNIEHREEIEGDRHEVKDFKACSKASAKVFRIHWASLGSQRELYVWVKNYLEKEEEEAREAYLVAIKKLNDAFENRQDTDALCAEQLRLSKILTAATHARQDPDDFVKHRVFAALEKALAKQFKEVLTKWVAQLSKGNEARDLEAKKAAIGRQLDLIRTAKDQAFYRCHKQKKVHGSV